MPAKIRPYAYLMRLDRPIGIWLLLLPSFWGIALAAGGLGQFTVRTWTVMVLFALGAVIMRGAGCVINDLWDRDLDKMVERTRGRPIASGAVLPKQALVFLATLLLFGLLILLQFNMTTILLGLLSLPLITTYPLMKRITWWPQAFLGLTFNFGALMGYSAIYGSVDAAALLLYISGFFWTIAYDTIYAHQDKDDDIMAGIKSTARLFNEESKFWVRGFYGLSAISLLVCFIVKYMQENTETVPYVTLILFGVSLLYLGRIMAQWKPDIQESSLKSFKANYIFGLIIFCAILGL